MNQFVKTYKKRVSGVISLLLTICLISPANAEQVYYCSAELATGMIREDGKWITSQFEPNRYTIKFNSDFTQVEGFRNFVDIPLNCHFPFSFYPELLSCSGKVTFLTFNKENLRFSLFLGNAGYVLDLDTPDIDAMIAGACEAF